MFTKGQKVVCVNADFPIEVKKAFTQLPIAGETYTVRSTFVGRSTSGQPGEIGVLLEELTNPKDIRVAGKTKPELGFSAERFSDAA